MLYSCIPPTFSNTRKDLNHVVPKTHPGRLRAGSRRVSRKDGRAGRLVGWGGEESGIGIDGSFFLQRLQERRVIRLAQESEEVVPNGDTVRLAAVIIGQIVQGVPL